MLIKFYRLRVIQLAQWKQYLRFHFVTKDMGKLKYFLGIKVVHQKHSVLLSQRKYAQDLLKKT